MLGADLADLLTEAGVRVEAVAASEEEQGDRSLAERYLQIAFGFHFAAHFIDALYGDVEVPER